MKSSNRLQIRYHLSSGGPSRNSKGTSITNKLLRVQSSLPERTRSNNSSSNSKKSRTAPKPRASGSSPKVPRVPNRVVSAPPRSSSPSLSSKSSPSSSNSTTGRGGSSQQSNARRETPENKGGSREVATATYPSKKMKVNRSNNQGNKKVVDSGRTGIFKNERSTTYRRDFIKANPPFLGKWYMCSLCFKPVSVQNMQVDHIFPVSKGGSNSTKNLGPLCAPCNRDKSNKVDSRILHMFAIKLGGNAIGVPLSLGFRGITFVAKTAGKTALFVGKHALNIVPKILGAIFTWFMAMSFKGKLFTVGLLYFIYVMYL